ncbi:MAG TPA: translocation/assembly module TamB domain-containing protein, partial [Stellaceae bacterium]
VTLAGDWNGQNLGLRGQVTGLKDDNIVFSGSAPLRLTRAPLALSVPADGRIALNLRGQGRLDRLADLLPLGEDRVSGRFSADVSVGGSLAAPVASGRLRLADARWENFASGIVLTGIEADLAGDRDRFQLASFTAADTAGGRIEARGSLVLARPGGPAAELSARLAHLRIAARDEAVVTASGTVAVAGPVTAPKITGHLTIDKAEINLPQGPPPNVVRLDVVVAGGKPGKPPSGTAANALLAAPLDLKLDAPGPVFVRGHGLDSQWRGKLTIGGTTATPDITGRLEQIQGSFDLLGKTFQLTRGAIVFGGGATLDPTLDIVAEASAADITARIVVSGLASAPKITLGSTPALPQDEVLARVLFGQSVGRISAAQGLQLAQAAATLAGGGPGVLDRLRGKLGLDWLRLGQGPSGPASSILNPALANPSGTNNAALSAGKYLMPGVSVGVTQGVSPPTSKVTVQVEVRPHVTVQGEAGQSGNTGIGLNYQYDY